jgi:LacI family transcriptional regulator
MMSRPPNNKTDGRKTTSADVARAAGVSRTTVSLILNEVSGPSFTADTISRVKSIAAQLGYYPNVPARSVTTKKSYAIGLVSLWEPNSTLFARSFTGMMRFTRSVGYGLTICDVAGAGSGGVEATIEFYRQRRIDGVVALLSTFWPNLPKGVASTDYLTKLQEERIPFVLINSNVGNPTVDEICTDNFHAGYLGTQHLISLGHRHIGIMSRQAAGGAVYPC